MNNRQIKKLLNDYFDVEEPECRWCFAIDKQRVKGEVVTEYEFPDGCLQHLSCPRCGGEFTAYFMQGKADYVRERGNKLHPEWKGKIRSEKFSEIVALTMLEMFGKGERGLLRDFYMLLSA